MDHWQERTATSWYYMALLDGLIAVYVSLNSMPVEAPKGFFACYGRSGDEPVDWIGPFRFQTFSLRRLETKF